MSQTVIHTIRRSFVPILCLLAGAGLTSTTVDAQAAHGARPSQKEVTFEVISIRPLKPGAPGGTDLQPTPNGYRSSMTISQLIKAAYVPGFFNNWESTPLLNAPKWLSDANSNYYQVDARVAKQDIEAWQHQGPNRELLRSALRALLKDRCKLAMHTQPKEVPDYKLVVAKGGHKMMVNAPDPKLPPFGTLPGGGYLSLTKRDGRQMLELYCHAATMEWLSTYLSIGARFPPVHDETGLTGRYDFKLIRSHDAQDEVSLWQLEPLGLKLKPGKYQGFSIVIDHIEKPDAN